jgi:hypothetical protein
VINGAFYGVRAAPIQRSKWWWLDLIGIINNGSIKTGDAVLLGPDSNGNYQPTVVKSMQQKRFVLSFAEYISLIDNAPPQQILPALRPGSLFL